MILSTLETTYYVLSLAPCIFTVYV